MKEIPEHYGQVWGRYLNTQLNFQLWKASHSSAGIYNSIFALGSSLTSPCTVLFLSQALHILKTKAFFFQTWPKLHFPHSKRAETQRILEGFKYTQECFVLPWAPPTSSATETTLFRPVLQMGCQETSDLSKPLAAFTCTKNNCCEQLF